MNDSPITLELLCPTRLDAALAGPAGFDKTRFDPECGISERTLKSRARTALDEAEATLPLEIDWPRMLSASMRFEAAPEARLL